MPSPVSQTFDFGKVTALLNATKESKLGDILYDMNYESVLMTQVNHIILRYCYWIADLICGS